MKFKTTAYLLILLLITGGAAWWLITQRQNTSTQSTQKDQTLLGWLPTTVIDHITIETDDETLVFERLSSQGWTQTQPAYFPLLRPTQTQPGFRQLIDEMLAIPIDPDFLTSDNPPSASEVALDPPRAHVTFETREGQTVRIALGKQRDMAGQGYAMRDDDDQILLAGDLLHQLVFELPPSTYREPHLDLAGVHMSDTVEIQRAGEIITFTKDAAGRWQMSHQGQATRISQEMARALISTLHGSPILEFVDDAPNDLQDYGLAMPFIRVTTTRQRRENDLVHSTLLIGRPTNDQADAYYATWSPQNRESQSVLALSAQTIAPLLAPVDALRETRLLTFAMHEMKEATLWQGDASQTYHQLASQWLDENDQPAPQLQPLIETIAQAQAQAFLPRPSTSQPTLFSLVVESINGQTQTLRFYALPDEAQLGVWHAADSAMMIVEKQPFSAFIE